ncbi:unnamed protein product [Ectocarpus sp. CCAP 1310/34]|nr:unnamed protein product [Ectocarpus sp. CCAP 1310/34]
MILQLTQARCLQALRVGNPSMSGTLWTPSLPSSAAVLLGQECGSRVFSRGLKGQPDCDVKTHELVAPERPTPARLVVTHSSECAPARAYPCYMDGLIPLLDRFIADPDAVNSVSSVIPGRIYVVKGRSELFKMTVRDTTNGFKALARKGTLGQEVFISTTKMDLGDVKAALNRAAGFDLEKGGSRREQKAGRKRR